MSHHESLLLFSFLCSIKGDLPLELAAGATSLLALGINVDAQVIIRSFLSRKVALRLRLRSICHVDKWLIVVDRFDVGNFYLVRFHHFGLRGPK